MLLDANVLLYAVDARSRHNARAAAWLQEALVGDRLRLLDRATQWIRSGPGRDHDAVTERARGAGQIGADRTRERSTRWHGC